MTTRLIALGLAFAGASRAASPHGLGPRATQFSPAGFNAVGVDYKKPQVLTETFFNPFHVQMGMDAMQKRNSAAITDEAVTDAIGTRKISGVLYQRQAKSPPASSSATRCSPSARRSTFPDDTKARSIPWSRARASSCAAVAADSIGLDVSPETEATRRLNIPLRAFWHP